MIFLQKLLAFVVVLGTLVVVHELGHYLVARWCGVKVLRFSVGMGKVVWSRRFGRDQTEWAVSLLPLGGYVKMLDARDAEQGAIAEQDLAREFTRQSVWKRIAIVAAGPIANFLLAIVVFAGLFMHGIPEPAARLRAVAAGTPAYEAGLRGGELVTAIDGEPVRAWSDLRWALLRAAVDRAPVRLDTERPNPADAEGKLIDSVTLHFDRLTQEDLEADFLGKAGIALAPPPAVIGEPGKDGPAARAGLRKGDRIVAIDGAPVSDGAAMVETIRKSAGRALELTIVRGREERTLSVTPVVAQHNGQEIGRIEAPLQPELVEVSAGPVGALGKGVEHTWEMSVFTVKMIGKMLTGEASFKNITGPITIADYAGQTASIGIVSFLSFIALVSISLGVMNLLPIPVLDGGLLLYYSLEVLTGRPVSERVGELAQRAGLGILVTLMVVAVFNDIVRLIS